MLERLTAFEQALFVGVALENLQVEPARLHVAEVTLQLTQLTRAVEQVDLAVVVKQQGGIMEVGRTGHECPRTRRVLRAVYVAPVGFVVGREPDVEQSVVVTDARRPLSASVDGTLQQVIAWQVGQLLEDIADGLPVDEVLRPHHRAARHEVHRRADEVVVVAHANHRGVGHVGIDNRVAECLLLLRHRPRRKEEEGSRSKQMSEFHRL